MRRNSTYLMALTAIALIFLQVPSANAEGADGVLPAPADDAGSGGDAGDTFATAVGIEPDVVYEAGLDTVTVGSRVTFGDVDWFTFEVGAGQEINAAVTAANLAGCLSLRSPDGAEIASWCGTSLTRSFTELIELSGVTAPVDGVYALEYGYSIADGATYEFGVGLDEPSPLAPGEVDLGTPVDLEPGRRPQVVVAVADTGVNPYHEIYHRPEFTEHPCTWVEGFDDCSIPALELSIGEYDTYEEAYAADAAVWASLSLHQWYWIPKTNIIGAVCDGSVSISTVGEQTCIRDVNGHGTGTTSSVLSEAPDALLLVHQGNAGALDLATAPVVPDIQSHSWSAAVPLPLHAADPALQLFDQGLANPGAFDAETIFFIAAGNEAPFPTILDFTKVHPAVQVVGGGFPGYASARSWSAYDFASWFCRPTAAHDDLVAVQPSSCGTSFAAPTAAGTAAAALLEIRRREGTNDRSTTDMVSATVTRAEFIAALRAGATYTPQPDRFPNKPIVTEFPLVAGQEHLLWGHGWLDRTRVDAIVACALDGVCPGKSPEAEQYNATRQEVRRRSVSAIGGG